MVDGRLLVEKRMMQSPTQVKQRLSRVFNEDQADVLTEVIHDAYSDLVHTSDFNELKDLVAQLAKAQVELAEAQQRTELRVEELAEAQQRTERALQRLARQVGGLSDRIGGDLEDIAYIVLHDVLEREFGWKVGQLERTWFTWDGKEVEVDIFGKAFDPAQEDKTIWIVGEAKYNLTLKDVKRFKRVVQLARENLEGELFGVCFCYRARPEVRMAVQHFLLVAISPPILYNAPLAHLP